MFYVVSTLEETFNSIEEARQAWIDADCPKQRGSSVWISENCGVETLRTITLANA